jgi:peptidoglycan/LPS O-acetylase OafA/YrhL
LGAGGAIFSMRGVWMSVIGMILLAPVLRWHFHTPTSPETFTFYCRMDGLGFGSLIALVHQRERLGDKAMQSVAGWIRRAWMVLLPLWLVVAIPTHGDQSSRIFNAAGISLADAIFASMVFAVIGNAGGSGTGVRLLRLSWLRSIGKVSYTLYLVHYPFRVLTIWVFEKQHLDGREE